MGTVNKLGTNVITAVSMTSRLDMITTITVMSFSQAISTFAGQNIGASKIERILTGMISTAKMMGIVTFVTTLSIVIFGHFMMGLFTTDPEVIRLGDQYLTIVSLLYILFTLMFIYMGVMRGAGDTLIPMFISLLSLWLIRIPFAWYISGKIGESGVWWSRPAGWLIGLSLSCFYYKTGMWKLKSVVKYSANL